MPAFGSLAAVPRPRLCLSSFFFPHGSGGSYVARLAGRKGEEREGARGPGSLPRLDPSLPRAADPILGEEEADAMM